MNEINLFKFKKHAVALAVASCLSFTPYFAEAASLGRLTVLSGLGQPLRAELELGATRDELKGMAARLAPQDVFRQAGVDYVSALGDLRFGVEKRANGKSVLRVTSGKAMNEPFLDFLVELNWPAGRLVREYTFLLDPPEIALNQSSRTSVDARVVETVRDTRKAAPERPAPIKAEQPVAAATPPATEGGRVVQRGDTLRKIAAETKYEGVSLEQMLVGLFQKNPDAFDGKNINRLKAGAILGIPDKAAVEAVAEADAKKVYLTQAADWNAYRQKLAQASAKAAPKAESASQSSSGKITATKVEERATPAEQSKDQLRVSRTEVAGASAAKAAADGEADRVAKEKALKEAQEKLSLLEKNVNELQKLVEMKNQKLAELQKPPAKQEEVKPPVVEPVAVKPVEVPPVVELPKPAVVEPPIEPPKPVVPPPPAPVPPPVTAPAPAIEPQPLPEPSFFDALLGQPLALAGGGLIALLGGYFLYRRRRGSQPSSEMTAAPGLSSFGPNSVFRMTGGHSVDTGNTPPQTGDFSQTGPGTIDTDEVDPVAEADVYMAYGRDAQAEEILLEALQKDPQRTAIHAKLLEIYANRRSLKQFETLASELYSQTAGVGADWAKVAALGMSLDPNNPLYSGSRAPAIDPEATLVESPENVLKAILAAPPPVIRADVALVASEPLPEAVSQSPEVPVAEPRDALPVVAAAALTYDETSLDFDLGTPEPEPVVPTIVETRSYAAEEAYTSTVVTNDPAKLDFDLATDTSLYVTNPGDADELTLPTSMEDDALDFDLTVADSSGASEGITKTAIFPPVGASSDVARTNEMSFDIDSPTGHVSKTSDTADLGAGNAVVAGDAALPKHPELASQAAAVDDGTLDFEINLTDSVFLGQPMIPPEFDMGSINLDLAAEPLDALPEPTATPVESLAAGPAQHDEQWEEVNTKLDLAKAYEEMGDLEGARELLFEVVGEGAADLVEQARGLLAKIGE